MTTISIQLDVILKEKNLKLSYIAAKTGISYQQLWNIKQGKTKKIYLETIGLLLDACECSLDELFLITK